MKYLRMEILRFLESGEEPTDLAVPGQKQVGKNFNTIQCTNSFLGIRTQKYKRMNLNHLKSMVKICVLRCKARYCLQKPEEEAR